jgi:hypothetical protein
MVERQLFPIPRVHGMNLLIGALASSPFSIFQFLFVFKTGRGKGEDLDFLVSDF